MADIAYIPGNFFLLRTPALEYEISRVLGDRARLDELIRRPEVRAAIALASRSFLTRLPESLSQSEPIPRALIRYVARMAGRCTPFGLFAGVSTGRVSAELNLRIPDRSQERSVARLDAELVRHVSDAVLADTGIRANVEFFMNPTAFLTKSSLQLAKPTPGASSVRYELVSLQRSVALSEVARYFEGKKTSSLRGLADALEVILGVTAVDAQAYVDQLVEQRVLLPKFGHSTLGSGDGAFVADLEALLGPRHELAATVSKLQREIENCKVGPAHEIVGRAQSVVSGSSLEHVQPTLMVDLVKPAPELSITQAVANEICRGASQLIRMCPRRRDPYLERFASTFRRRYEDGQVPLLQALDPSFGIGEVLTESPYPAYLRNVAWEAQGQRAGTRSHQTEILSRLLGKGLAETPELVLTDGDLARIQTGGAQTASHVSSVMCTILAPTEDHVRAGDYKVHIQFVTRDATAVLGRFTSTDTDLKFKLASMVESTEGEADVLRPDIVHAPHWYRSANPVSRPRIRKDQLWVLGFSTELDQEPIELRDLSVRVSADQRITLIHGPSGRAVEPRLSNAQNFVISQSLHIYRFLSGLSYQESGAGSSFEWGREFADQRFLPRVSWDRFIFSPATWQIPSEAYKSVRRKSDSDLDRLAQTIRVEQGLPRFVGAGDEGELPLDLDQPWARIELAKMCPAERMTPLKVQELLDLPDSLPVSGAGGRFRHELVLPIAPVPEIGPAARRKSTGANPVRHLPGGAWFYAKLYANEAVLDDLLTSRGQALMRNAFNEAACDRWHFVRYADPDSHVRFRLRLRSPSSTNPLALIQSSIASFLKDGRVWDVAIASYSPEVDRYGGPAGLELCERAFQLDSEMALRALPKLRLGDDRLLFQVRMVVAHLDAFAVPPELRAGFLKEQSALWKTSLGLQPGVRHTLAKSFNDRRPQFLAACLGEPGSLPSGLLALIERYSQRLRPIAQKLLALDRRDRLSTPLSEVVASLIHMSVNRLSPNRPNQHEVVIYDGLERTYASIAARRRFEESGRE